MNYNVTLTNIVHNTNFLSDEKTKLLPPFKEELFSTTLEKASRFMSSVTPLISSNEQPITEVAQKVFEKIAVADAQSMQEILVKSRKEEVGNPTFDQDLRIDFSGHEMSSLDQEEYKNSILALNPNHQSEEIFSRKIWNPAYYSKENMPVILGFIENKESFSSLFKEKGLRFLDLPIHIPGQGWRIPIEVEQFREVIEKTVAFEKVLDPDFEQKYFVYITVDQGVVESHKAQRRKGWHGDSYIKSDLKAQMLEIPVDHVYVVANNCPTQFLAGPFSLEGVDTRNVDAVLEKFAKEAEGKLPTYYPDYAILRVDPYCVHDVGFNNSGQAVHRTFVKISVSPSKYCKLGNAHNNLFDYNWPMIPRHHVPYSFKAIQESSHRKDRDHFVEINPSEVDFSQEYCNVTWAKPKILDTMRTASVYAIPAKKGEILSSVSDGFLITINIAKEGDWKITVSTGEQYFLSQEKLFEIYETDLFQTNRFVPKKEIRKVIELIEDVRFYAPWGTLQYARKGDFIIYRNPQDIYAIPKELFTRDFSLEPLIAPLIRRQALQKVHRFF